MKHLFTRYPLTVWAVGALILLVLLHTFNAQYYELPLGLLVLTSGFWAWMYWLPSETLFTLNAGTAAPYHESISFVAGLFHVAGW